MPPKKRPRYSGGTPPPPQKRIPRPQIISPEIFLPRIPPEYKRRTPNKIKKPIFLRNRMRVPGSRREKRHTQKFSTPSTLISFTKLSNDFIRSEPIKKNLKKLCFRIYAEHPAPTKWMKAKAVGSLIGKNPKTVLKWVQKIAEKPQFAFEEKRGGFRPSTTLLNSEELKRSLTTWIRSNSIRKGAPNMTILSFTNHVNSKAIPEYWSLCRYTTTPPTIHEATARRWLHRLGFEPKKRKRGIYIDGHDAEENIQARMKFCREYQELMLRAPLWITRRQVASFYEQHDISSNYNYQEGYDEVLPVDQFPSVDIRQCAIFQGLGGGFHPSFNLEIAKPVIFYSHDESIFHANEDQNSFWGDNDLTGLAKKSQGQGIMVSDFKSEVGSGSLAFTAAEYERYLENRRNPIYDGLRYFDPPREIPFGPLTEPLPISAREFLEYGKSKQGYWTNDLFVKQVKTAIEIHNVLYPNFQAVFLFDHSSGHRKMPDDGLVAHRMNRSPDGCQPFMRNGIGRRGAEAICRERNLFYEGMTLAQMITVLSNQPDFLNQKTIVEEVIQDAGHHVLFIPKYHCELNFIEMNWAKAKRKTRECCDYTFKTLKQNVPLALDQITVSDCRQWARKSRDFMAAYLAGVSSQDAEKQIKLYKSHRKVYLPVNYAPDTDPPNT